jgi:hypothetical protein
MLNRASSTASGRAVRPAASTVLRSRYRFAKVLAWNNADGMTSTFTYGKAQTDVQETQISVPVTYDEVTWTVGGSMTEQQSRGTERTLTHSSHYHYVVWANYKENLVEYLVCTTAGCRTWDQWEPAHWNGQLTGDNPDRGKNGKVIGGVPYAEPKFDPNPNHHVILHGGTAYSAYTTHTHSFGWNMNVGLSGSAWVGMNSTSAYNTNTRVHWALTKASKCPHTDLLWGSGTDVPSAPVVMASCEKLS